MLVTPKRLRIPLVIKLSPTEVPGTERNHSRKQNKGIEIGNRLLTKLSPKGKANLLKIQEIVRENFQYANSEDFAGRGLLVDILDIEKRKKGKYGPGITIKFLDCKSNRERIWNTSSIAHFGLLDAFWNRVLQECIYGKLDVSEILGIMQNLLKLLHKRLELTLDYRRK